MSPDENDQKPGRTASVVITAVTILIVAIVLWQAAGAVTVDNETKEYVLESAEWCDEQNGELQNSNSLSHGGLHCELPNGTSVHMSEVINRAD